MNFFDPSTPSMRKGRDGEKKNEKRENNDKKIEQAGAELCQAQAS